MKRNLLALLAYSLCYLPIASAEETDKHPNKGLAKSGFFYGFMAAYKTGLYSGVDNVSRLLPAIGYQGEKIKVLGPLVSYQLLKSEQLSFDALLKYRFAGYEGSDSDALDGMQDRDASLDLGMRVNYKQHKWSSRLSVLHDVLGRSNGLEINATVGKTVHFGPVFVEPNLGITYWDNQYVDYYYGVEKFEITATRGVYKGAHAINKKLGLNIASPIFFKGFTRLSLEHTWYDSSVKNSPITDEDKSLSVGLTFTRFF